jgi:predicted porin
MVFRRIFTIFLLIASPLALADMIDASLNNNAAAFKFSTGAGALVQGNSDIQLGVLYNDSMNNMGEVGMLVKGEEGDASGATLAVGVKALVGMIKNYIPGTTENVGAVVIGGELAYAFPAAKQLSAAIDYFAGPKITSFGDCNRANLWAIHADYEVSPGTKVYVEHREANFGITNTGVTATLDAGTYLGVKLTF